MNAQELMFRNGTPSGVWQCGKCGVLHAVCHAAIAVGGKELTHQERLEWTARKAQECCDEKCQQCGKPARKYHSFCDACENERRKSESVQREQEAFAKATERTDYDGPFMFNDRYFEDMEAVLEHVEWQELPMPEYLWVPHCEEFHIDADDIVSNALEDHYEDADDQIGKNDMARLQAFLDEWCDGVGIKSYTEMCKEYVRVPKEKP